MARLLHRRLERLACDFPLEDNYFAWQAFGRAYDRVNRRAVPRYLRAEPHETLRPAAGPAEIWQPSMHARLAEEPATSFARSLLLHDHECLDSRQIDDMLETVRPTTTHRAKFVFLTTPTQT